MVSNQLLLEVLSDWSFWDNKPPVGFARAVDLPTSLQPDLVLVIQGVRRCGKSTLLTQIPARYQLSLANCFYCNFEDPRLLGSLDHTLLSQILNLARKDLPANHNCYFFLDEIQNVLGWEKWLHTQLERPKNNYYIVTGSNSSLLSGEFGTALTGRHITVELYPYSLSEYQSIFTDKNLEDYLLSGGFPRAVTFEQPYKLLQEYFHDIILRDVLRRVHSRTPESIKQVMKMAFDTCGTELSYRKIAAVTGLTVDTVKSYLDACEQAYLIFACPYFSYSEKQRQLKHKKYYPIDTGLRYAISGTQGRDFGKSLEILAFLALKQRYKEVYYWQEPHQGEVDFIVKKENEIIPYQVSWNGSELRHHKALNNFYQAHPYAGECVVVTGKNIQSIFDE